MRFYDIFAQRLFEMTAVLTGDIVNSRKVAPSIWMPELKEILNTFGKTPKQWEIYRGDSFQLETQPHKALEAALLLKAGLKQYKALDVRIAIGIGKNEYDAPNISEANGSAFIHSGQCFDELKTENLAIKSSQPQFNLEMNLMFKLASLSIDQWPPVTATIVKTALLNPNKDQNQMAKSLQKDQSNISRALKRGGFEAIKALILYYRSKVEVL